MLYVQVLEKNARWDKYSAEREKHVMSLQRETTALADQLAKLRLAHSAGVSEIQQDKVSRSVTSLQHVTSRQRETTALADQLAKLRLAHSADVSEIQQDKVSRSEYAAVVAVVAAAAMGGLFFA